MPPKTSRDQGRGRPSKSSNVVASSFKNAIQTGAGAGAKSRNSTAGRPAAVASRRKNDGVRAEQVASAGRKRKAEDVEEDAEEEVEGDEEDSEGEGDEWEEEKTLEEDNDDDEEDELLEMPSAASVVADKRKKASKRSSDVAADSGAKRKKRRSDAEAESSTAAGTARKRVKEDKGKEERVVAKTTTTTTSSKAKFSHLKPRTRHISQSVITTKWRPAPLPAQAAARALFITAKRPVVEAAGRRASTTSSSKAGVMGDGYDKRKTEAETTLASVLRKLDKQIPRIPFPPMKAAGAASAAEVFELEKVVERNRMLEAQLTPAIHAVKLLKEVVVKEEEVLEKEREGLEVLEQRAREAERRGRERGKRGLHPALKRFRAGNEPSGSGSGGKEDGADEIRLVTAGERRPMVDEEEMVLDSDEQLAPVWGQLRGHLESMQANLEQVEGLDEAMNGARVALDGVLRGRLGGERYEGLMSSS
ncbi:hypothetical protein DIS24_g1488 [Lasiodiplodia hormozganensis]|uniref:Kinetochore protein fta7 n=1 Tax=Lasiodiplodia hormozganensis TaxID=869390 RepID=A0AA39Z2Y3_9PEZI|nr:hypothetical protein DIS24_g1488 [Lasiodiplodia hormozganensis]